MTPRAWLAAMLAAGVAAGSAAMAQDAAAPPQAAAPSPAPAAPSNLTPPPPPPSWVAQPAADLLALDKITARVTRLALKPGETSQFESLTITLRACVARPPDQRADAAAFLEITDQHQTTAPFRGWMVVSAPAVSMYANPVYDIRPAGCHG